MPAVDEIRGSEDLIPQGCFRSRESADSFEAVVERIGYAFDDVVEIILGV